MSEDKSVGECEDLCIVGAGTISTFRSGNIANGKSGVVKKIVIIPAFNEEKSIIRQCEEVHKKAKGFDVLVVNDCSEDETYRLCVDNGIKVINHSVNLGIGGAVQTGYRYALHNGYEVAVQIDGDGQHDASFLGDMYETLVKERADMVIGSRFLTNEGFQSTPLRRLGIDFFTFLIRLLTGKTITDPTSGCRMIGSELLEEFAKDYPQDYPEPESVVRAIRKGKKIVEIPVMMRDRRTGRSSIGVTAAVYYMIKVTIAIILERIRND